MGSSVIILTVFLIGKAFGITKTIVVEKMPENPICQPFRTVSDHKAQQAELAKIGAKPVMDQMLLQAFKDHSAGRGELLRVAEYVCKEHPGSLQSARATTYYFSPGAKK